MGGRAAAQLIWRLPPLPARPPLDRRRPPPPPPAWRRRMGHAPVACAVTITGDHSSERTGGIQARYEAWLGEEGPLTGLAGAARAPRHDVERASAVPGGVIRWLLLAAGPAARASELHAAALPRAMISLILATSGSSAAGVASSPPSVVRPVVPSPNMACEFYQMGRAGRVHAVGGSVGGSAAQQAALLLGGQAARCMLPQTARGCTACGCPRGRPTLLRASSTVRMPPAGRAREQQQTLGGCPGGAARGVIRRRRPHLRRPSAAACREEAHRGGGANTRLPPTGSRSGLGSRRSSRGPSPWTPRRSGPAGSWPVPGGGPMGRGGAERSAFAAASRAGGPAACARNQCTAHSSPPV